MYPEYNQPPPLGFAGPSLPMWKRVLDLMVCGCALPPLAVVALIVWITTRISSPGPIFFLQERVGYLGRSFKLYKFRTMHLQADVGIHQNHLAELIRSNAPMQKMDARGDPRLIPGGWIIRASGLDELPQIINVLRGEMSLVGPRPCLRYEYEQYTAWQRTRFRSIPGLTGLWQVSGKNRTTFDEMIRLDIRYGERLSLWTDLRIIFLTPIALVRQIIDTRQSRRAQAPAHRAITLTSVSARPSEPPRRREPASVARLLNT